MNDKFKHKITDPNAPERLKGLIITAVLTEKEIKFRVEMPDTPTPQEIGYFRLFVGELMDRMQEETGLDFQQHPPQIIPKK